MNEQRECVLSEHEQELLTIIRSSENPSQAIATAVEIIVAFLAQL